MRRNHLEDEEHAMIPNTSEAQIGAELATPQLDPAVKLLAGFARIKVRMFQAKWTVKLSSEERQYAEELLTRLLGRQPTNTEIDAVVNW